MKRFNIKRMIALMLSVAMLLTGIPGNDIRVNADEYTAVSAAQEVTLPDGKVGTVSGRAEIIPANIKFEDNDTDLLLAEEQPEEGVKLVLDINGGHGGKVRDRIQNFNNGEGVEIEADTLFFLEYEASADFDLTKIGLKGTTSANGWTEGFDFSRQSNANGVAVYLVSCKDAAVTQLFDIRLKGDAGKIADKSSITIKNAYFVNDIKDAEKSKI